MDTSHQNGGIAGFNTTQPEQAKRSEVEQEMYLMDEAIETLKSFVAIIYGRLDPALRPPTPGVATERPMPPGPVSALAQAMRSRRDRLQDETIKLSTLIDRIEI